jgi:hypothetical protein
MSHKQYLRGRKEFPLVSPTHPRYLLDTMFQNLKAQCPLPPQQKHAKAASRPWLSEATIKLMDTRCALRKDSHHSRVIARQLDRQTRRSIHNNRKKRTEEAGKTIKAALNNGSNQKDAHKVAKSWYRHMGDRPPKPTQQDLRTTANEYTALYQPQEPPEEPIPTHVAPAHVDNSVPSEEEIDKAIHRLHNGRATCPS